MPNDPAVTVSPLALKWRIDPPAVDGRGRTVLPTISASSVEYVTVLVAARENGADVDLSSDATVRFAFVAEGEAPEAGDWESGTWDTDSTFTPTRYYARIVVGTGDTDLAAGTYDVWLEVTDAPETVVRKCGNLVVT